MEMQLGIKIIAGWPLRPSLRQGELEYDTINLGGMDLHLMTTKKRKDCLELYL